MSGSLALAEGPPAQWSYEVVETLPHDPDAFTQGLAHDGAVLYLGTGKYGASSIRRVDPPTGVASARVDLDGRLFGEGVAKHGGVLYQLTWRSGLVLTYDAATLRRGRTLSYRGEGWGLTSDGRQLIMSNGSDVLTGRDPETFAALWNLPVTRDGRPVTQLNELEFINGRIFANVWKSDEIVVINPSSGRVEAVMDCSALVRETRQRVPSAGVLNGIAYDERRGLVLVTGKLWDRIYVLRVGE